MTTGLWVLLGTLVLATALGLAKRWYDGRFRPVATRPVATRDRAATSGGPAAPVGGPVDGSATGPAATADDPDGAAARAATDGATDGLRLSSTDLGGADLGARATLVQFSTAFCAPCRATRRILTEVADVVPGVAHVEIDAESHLDLVRRFDVLRTPTTLVLDADGRVTTRASGQPRKEQVLATLPL